MQEGIAVGERHARAALHDQDTGDEGAVLLCDLGAAVDRRLLDVFDVDVDRPPRLAPEVDAAGDGGGLDVGGRRSGFGFGRRRRGCSGGPSRGRRRRRRRRRIGQRDRGRAGMTVLQKLEQELVVLALQLGELHDELVLPLDLLLERGELAAGRRAPRRARFALGLGAPVPGGQAGQRGGDHRGCTCATHALPFNTTSPRTR